MSRNPYFVKALDEMQEIHDRKNADYAHESNPFSNFEHAAAASGIPAIQVFDVLLGVKQARLSELSDKGRTPNNESIRDTLLDRAVYATIALAYFDWVQDGRPAIGEQVFPDPIGGLPSEPLDPSGDDFHVTLAAPNSTHTYVMPPDTQVSFTDTLEKAGALADRGSVARNGEPLFRAQLNPHRHVRDTDGFPPPNPILDVADLHTEGD